MLGALLAFCRVAILALGVAALARGALTQAPFSSAALLAGPTGEPLWLGDWSPMMHPASYRLEAGREFLIAAQAAEGEERRRLQREATRLFAEAGEHWPLDGDAWTYLALSAALDGEAETALEALEESWRLAPEDPTLITLRIDAATMLWTLLSEERLDRVAGDLDTLRAQAPSEFERLTRENRRMALLARQRLSGGILQGSD